MASGNLILPGQQFTAAGYLKPDRVLYSALNRVECVVDGAPIAQARPDGSGSRGRLYIVEPKKATRVPHEAARFILEHLSYLGVVEVQQEETEQGITYHVEEAVQDSLKLTEEQDKARFERYVAGVVDDFVKKAKPVPQPDPAILKIIERRGYDLKDYGIVPIGWKEPDKDARVAQLEAMVKAMADQLARMDDKQETKKAKHREE